MTSLKTSIKTITYLSDIGCLEIQGASLLAWEVLLFLVLMALQLMAKAADNADWKARWGSVHHTDRTLLAHYRASLKSAIQRKANITQAISRYEKLLNRTQKAATDIKRLRPLVEDAINKGILDVDPDLVNHANEFLVIGDRSWRVGQYYDCAGDIVRIKSLDFDSQRADVEIIFTFKGTKSGNWDVKTLDKQVDVTPDEDAVMQKISGGVSIAGINDIISCDDFYRFQQRGMIKITDSYGVQTTESGYSIDFVGTYTDPLKHAVYPDRRDGALKSSIAKWVLGMMSEGNNRQVRLAEVFLTELFGSNYGEVIASYGDTLSPEAIQETIADAIARMPEKTSQGATRNGDSELEVTNAIFGTIRRSLAASEGEEQRFPGQLVDYRDKTQRGGRSGRHPTIRITGAPGSPGVA